MYTLCRLTWILLYAVVSVFPCPEKCYCGYDNTSGLTVSGFFTTDCSQQQLKSVPLGLPNLTQLLNLSHNEISAMPEDRVSYLYHIQLMDIRENRGLRQIPLVTAFLNISAIYTDSGATCCRYIVDWENKAGAAAKNQATQSCIATVPVNECVKNILGIFDFIIYGLVLVLAPPLNILVLVVTLGTKARLRDPVTFTTTQYSISNILLITYAAVIFTAGIVYRNIYPQYMEEWLDNPGCSFVGFILITSTLASTFFHMLDGITLFLKLHYPFNLGRHMTLRRLGVYIVLAWTLALLLAAIPFFTGGRYNQVHLCLPFYAGDYDFSFKYVILYTTFCGVAIIVEVVMVIWLLRSVIQTRADGGKSPMLTHENKRLQNTVTSMIVFKIVFSIVIVIFLGFSCAGGHDAQIGRNYFATISIIESVLNPVMTVVRKKQFRRDTLKLLKKCHCYKGSDSFRVTSYGGEKEHSHSFDGASKFKKTSRVEPEPKPETKAPQLFTVKENFHMKSKTDSLM